MPGPSFVQGQQSSEPSLPNLILIADQFTRSEVVVKVEEAVQAGVEWVHLRDHAATDVAFESSVAALVTSLQGIAPDINISINGRLTIADDFGLHYHTGKGKPFATHRGILKTGYSAHTVEEGMQLAEAGVDYLFYSPIFATSSKPGHKGVGLDDLKTFCKAVGNVPVYALGGITPENCAACLKAGAQGVALLSGLLNAPAVSTAVTAYKTALAYNHAEN
ncbi:MAG: thiamine phosphate synthase [Rhodothermales bacterium]